MRGTVYMLVWLFFGVGVNGSNPFNRTKKNNSDAATKFEDYIRNIPHPLHETGLTAEGDSEDLQLDGILGETTEVDEYRVTSITKRAVQTKKVFFILFSQLLFPLSCLIPYPLTMLLDLDFYLYCWLICVLFGTLNISLLYILVHF